MSPEKARAAMDKYNAKLRKIGEWIIEQRLDFVGLQEVFDDGSLEDLEKVVEELDGGDEWHSRIADKGDSRGIHTAALSDHEILESEDVVDVPDDLPALHIRSNGERFEKMSRAALKVRFKLGKVAVTAIVVHLKAKLVTYKGGRQHTDDPFERIEGQMRVEAQQIAEAATIARAFQAEIAGDDMEEGDGDDTEEDDGDGNDKAVIAMGDWNSTADESPMRLMRGAPGSRHGTKAADRPDAGDAVRGFVDTDALPHDQRGTIKHNGEWHDFDHMVMTNDMRKAFVPEGSGIQEIPEARYTDEKGNERTFKVTDHKPKVVEFRQNELGPDDEEDDFPEAA